jgi:hypothetical protein
MSHIRIDNAKATKKWAPVLENMGVTGDRVEWMAEYAEFHSINENAYVNASNVAGMGNVLNPVIGGQSGQTINAFGAVNGSGDVGQNLLPVAMKIAAQTIGLDLVAVKPSPGPKIDLLYIDFQYDDTRLGDSDERPQVFKLNLDSTILGTVTTAINAQLTSANITQNQGGLQGGRLYLTVGTSSTITGAANVGNAGVQTEPGNKAGYVEFLGYSRIDGYPMFRAFRQANTAHTGINQFTTAWGFDSTRNTFSATSSMVSQITLVGTTSLSTATTKNVELVSALEDHIPGFSANWTGRDGASGASTGSYPMSRQSDDDSYAGVIGPKISSKSIAVGTIEVSSALRRTEIEDIKANTGMDIVQKMESILVNELSQTISKQIVAKIFEMGTLNRQSAPLATGATSVTATHSTIFDLNTNYAGSLVGGETTHAVQRKLITKIAHASNYIATEGRVGPAQYLITNGGLAAALQDIAGYTINPVKSKLNGQGQLYPVGSIGDISIYVDPYMRYNDNRIVLGRKNNPDQPGIIFVPYLMAQSISVISEATFAPRMLLRSRYAVAEVGWFPQKQFMTLVVTDAAQLLN